MSFARFPGMQPFGNHAVHIVVKDRRTMLLGVVRSEADRTIVGIRAKGVSGVFEVENGVLVR
jgi:osmotically-inducible protein OsmY